MDLVDKIGIEDGLPTYSRDQEVLLEYANVKLASQGLPTYGDVENYGFLKYGSNMLAILQERDRLLRKHLCPADRAIQSWLESYLSDAGYSSGESLLPTATLTLERHGLARVLSLPPDKDHYRSDLVESTRVKQGVCHNPRHDRRTTAGVFHLVEGGPPIPFDKRAVPKPVFYQLLKAALNPPQDMLRLPFTATQDTPAEVFLSLLLRPIVAPGVPGICEQKTLEIRFFAPGSLVSNLDFVESIFGNAGDPFLCENDARLDVDHWSGQTGCVILAPHLSELTKKDLGLPHVSDATERQRRDGMCWEREEEQYNDGAAFKVCARDHRGVVVTLIADNYFGYCKKEVKTQIGFAANLMGLAEEEHAGGALAFPQYDLGEDFELRHFYEDLDHRFADVAENYGDRMELQPQGYAIDKRFSDIFYVPADARISQYDKRLRWVHDGEEQSIKLLANVTYVFPNGYQVTMRKPEQGTRWRLVGTSPDGTFCHKPCTVSGGGKSEISKDISDMIVSGPVFVSAFQESFAQVTEILNKSYADRFRDPARHGEDQRALLAFDRSLGSVIKLLSPREEYSDEYNAWLANIPGEIRDLVFVVKRLYKPHWEENWVDRFSVDTINNKPGHELKYRVNKLINAYMRVGFSPDGSWRLFKARKDFLGAAKLQMEDDISASIVLPNAANPLMAQASGHPSMKFAMNCEYRLFQRPDEAVIMGYDRTTERNFGRNGNFFSNYEPMNREDAQNLAEDAIQFSQFTPAMQSMMEEFLAADDPDYCISSAHPRLVDGVPTKNPRYLQTRPDMENARASYLAEMGYRLRRRLTPEQPVYTPVDSVLAGRRNNPPDPDKGIRALAVYNPVHYQELPEILVDFVASLTGKSPSTTGAGSEGALTKGPFNCLPAIIDLNNALVSFALCEYPCFTSAAGCVGPKYRIDHDISLLIPEVWSRMRPEERDPQRLVEDGFLDKVEDFEHEGQSVLASRLGYRINHKFVDTYFGRVFANPSALFPEDLLKPELQDLDVFVDGVKNIVETGQRVAENYFKDETIDLACAPMRALLSIMAYGDFEGRSLQDPEIRSMFTREAVLESDWYQERINAQVAFEQHRLNSQIVHLEAFLADRDRYTESQGETMRRRLERARELAQQVRSAAYREQLVGTLGRDPAIPIV